MHDLISEVVASFAKQAMKASYGGVVIDERGRVMIREPANHYDGYVWTFAKGGQDQGETPEQTALREVQEELGIVGAIVAAIPGSFAGGTSDNKYFLMEHKGELGQPDWETQSVQWASREEAPGLISQTTNGTGKARDLAVLEAAYKVWDELHPS
jgi:8-oxo-dGTP diphosphatase